MAKYLNALSISHMRQVLNKFIFATICDRTNDVAPTVRTQALKVNFDDFSLRYWILNFAAT